MTQRRIGSKWPNFEELNSNDYFFRLESYENNNKNERMKVQLSKFYQSKLKKKQEIILYFHIMKEFYENFIFLTKNLKTTRTIKRLKI